MYARTHTHTHARTHTHILYICISHIYYIHTNYTQCSGDRDHHQPQAHISSLSQRKYGAIQIYYQPGLRALWVYDQRGHEDRSRGMDWSRLSIREAALERYENARAYVYIYVCCDVHCVLVW
jgi:hypothetical protein